MLLPHLPAITDEAVLLLLLMSGKFRYFLYVAVVIYIAQHVHAGDASCGKAAGADSHGQERCEASHRE